jgi:hypothetical protein
MTFTEWDLAGTGDHRQNEDVNHAMVLWVWEQLDSGAVVNNIGTFVSPFWHVIHSSETDACLCMFLSAVGMSFLLAWLSLYLHYLSVRDWCLSKPAPPTWCSDNQNLHILDAPLLRVWEGLPIPSPPSHVLCWYFVLGSTCTVEL